MTNHPKDPRRECERLARENLRLRDQLEFCRQQVATLTATVKRLRESRKADREKYEDKLAEKEAVINELKFRLDHANALLHHDGTNTGTPTSQTRAGQQKSVPNSRRSSGMRKEHLTVTRNHPFSQCQILKLLIRQTIRCRMAAAQNAALLTAFLQASLR